MDALGGGGGKAPRRSRPNNGGAARPGRRAEGPAGGEGGRGKGKEGRGRAVPAGRAYLVEFLAHIGVDVDVVHTVRHYPARPRLGPPPAAPGSGAAAAGRGEEGRERGGGARGVTSVRGRGNFRQLQKWRLLGVGAALSRPASGVVGPERPAPGCPPLPARQGRLSSRGLAARPPFPGPPC